MLVKIILTKKEEIYFTVFTQSALVWKLILARCNKNRVFT